MNHDKYPNYWAILAEKRFQGETEFLRVIHTHRKPENRFLRREDEIFNQDVLSDHIIVENYFGWMCQLWFVLSMKYRWSEGMYDSFFGLGVSLTNLQVSINPLRQEDGEHYGIVRGRLFVIGDDIVRKRRRAREKYRQTRKQRLSITFREMNGSDDDGETTQ